MKFLVDAQLPLALTRFLAQRGFDCLHVIDLGLANASDRDIWRYAEETGRLVISKDEDFLYLAGRGSTSAGLLWVRFGNCRTSVLLAAFERIWPRVEASVRAGDRIIELRE